MHGEGVSITSEQLDIAIRREHRAAGALANATTLLASIHVPVTPVTKQAELMPVCHSMHSSTESSSTIVRHTQLQSVETSTAAFDSCVWSHTHAVEVGSQNNWLSVRRLIQCTLKCNAI